METSLESVESWATRCLQLLSPGQPNPLRKPDKARASRAVILPFYDLAQARGLPGDNSQLPVERDIG